MTGQLDLALAGGHAIDPSEGWRGEAGKGELGSSDRLPPGPYSVGATIWQSGEGPPWTVRCGDGRAVAGHIPSREIAETICAALNRCEPAPGMK